MALTAPGILEITYGLSRVERMADAAAWFTRFATSDLIEVLAFDATAAVVAGRLRAQCPTPPTGARRSGSKPDQRAGWLLDIQIAACAWACGYEIATHNRRDFEALSALIASLYPGEAALAVLDGPEL